jgi:hypothetical protein
MTEETSFKDGMADIKAEITNSLKMEVDEDEIKRGSRTKTGKKEPLSLEELLEKKKKMEEAEQKVIRFFTMQILILF